MTTQHQFAIGSHLKVARQGYTHHGIYIGNGQVIHYEGFCELFKYAPVTIVSLTEFQGNAKTIKVVNYPKKIMQYSHQEIVARAKSRLGEDRYCLFKNNCEHFARWCVTGKAVSKQVRVAAGGLGGLLLLGAGLLISTTSSAQQWLTILS